MFQEIAEQEEKIIISVNNVSYANWVLIIKNIFVCSDMKLHWCQDSESKANTGWHTAGWYCQTSGG